MLAILTSFVIISYILLSLGDIFTAIYNKLCKTNEEYSILDTIILGISFISILLPLSSLWLPSNHYILLAYILISIIYWMLNRNRLLKYIKIIKCNFRKLTIFQIGFIAATLILFILYLTMGPTKYDSGFYHYQHIRWNEEYSVVPGLANLEDRFGFNSNSLLLSAIFTFRFLFGQAIHMLHNTFFVLILLWSINRLFRSNYELPYIFLFISLFIIFILMNSKIMLSDSNTDAIPLLLTFYYIVKTSLTPKWINHQLLLAFILPVTLITFKLSCVVFCLISLIIFINCIKRKDKRIITFLLSSSLLIVGLWLIRNVIISGYLIYPLYQIDLFSFDWKVPKGTAILQKEHIYYWAKHIYDSEFFDRLLIFDWNGIIKLEFLRIALNFILFIFVMLSPLLFVLNRIKRYAAIDNNIYYIYAISLICLVFGYISAPDFRFLDGYIVGVFFLTINAILLYQKKGETSFTKYGKATVVLICIACILITLKYNMAIYKTYFLYTDNEYTHLLYKPLMFDRGTKFTEYKSGEITIYVTKKPGAEPGDILPATSSGGLPFEPFLGDKIQDVKTIETRGRTLQEGFRTKDEYIEPINSRVEEYLSIYLKRYEK